MTDETDARKTNVAANTSLALPTDVADVKPTVPTTVENEETIADVKPTVPTTVKNEETIVDDADEEDKEPTLTLPTDVTDVKPTVPTTVENEETIVDDADEEVKEPTLTLPTDVTDVKPTVPSTVENEETIADVKPTVPTTVENEETIVDDADEEAVLHQLLKENASLKDNVAKLTDKVAMLECDLAAVKLLGLVLVFLVFPWTRVFLFIFSLAASGQI